MFDLALLSFPVKLLIVTAAMVAFVWGFGRILGDLCLDKESPDGK